MTERLTPTAVEAPMPKKGAVRIVNETGHSHQTRVEVYDGLAWTLLRGVQVVEVRAEMGKQVHAFIHVAPVMAHFTTMEIIEAKGATTG